MIVSKRQPHEFSPTVQKLLNIANEWHAEQHGDEFGAFLEWLLSHEYRSTRILEIGTRQGGTAATWASLPNVSHVITVDINPQEETTHAKLVSSFPYTVTGIIGNSADESTRCNILGYSLGTDTNFRVAKMYYDMIFLDGDHSAQGVRSDLEYYQRLLRPGGLVVFHDIVDTPFMRSCGHGVYEVWNALQGDKTEFLLGNAEWGGIGVWRKP